MATETENEEKAERRPTTRVVLRAERVIVLPEAVEPEQIAAAVDALMPKAKRAEKEAAVADAWVEVARVEAMSKQAAIETHAGKPGTPDAKQGTFRAPSLTAWKDARVYSAPPVPLVEVTSVE